MNKNLRIFKFQVATVDTFWRKVRLQFHVYWAYTDLSEYRDVGKFRSTARLTFRLGATMLSKKIGFPRVNRMFEGDDYVLIRKLTFDGLVLTAA